MFIEFAQKLQTGKETSKRNKVINVKVSLRRRKIEKT